MLATQQHTIYIDNITLSYPNGTLVLRNASATIPAGSITYILGASGSGKSTLMQSMIGLLSPKHGRIAIASNDIYTMPSSLLYRLMGVVFQNGALLEDKTIAENIELILQQNTNFSDSMIEHAIHTVLSSVDLIKDKYKYPSQLSGGMKKRAALARALVLEKKILICDEPTSGLDPIATAQIDKLLIDIHATQHAMTLCIISHDIRSALAHASHIILLHNNTLYEFPSPEALLAIDDDYIATFIATGLGTL